MSNFRVQAELTIEECTDLLQKTVAQAHTVLANNGFTSPAAPQWNTQAGMAPYRGELPSDITMMSDDNLGYLMGRLCEWQTYVQFKLAEADSQLTAAKSEMELVMAKLRISYRVDEENKKRSNPERDDYVGADRRYVEAQSKVVYWETIWRYTKAIASGADNAFSTVSRRITQRGQEVERERRNQGISRGNIAPNGPMFNNSGPRRHQ